jgi:hypothetical protein
MHTNLLPDQPGQPCSGSEQKPEAITQQSQRSNSIVSPVLNFLLLVLFLIPFFLGEGLGLDFDFGTDFFEVFEDFAGFAFFSGFTCFTGFTCFSVFPDFACFVWPPKPLGFGEGGTVFSDLTRLASFSGLT